MVGAALFAIRVDLSLVFGLLSFLLNFIPNVGSVIATLLPLPIVAFDPSKSWVDVLFTFLGPGLIHVETLFAAADKQMTIGNLIEPRVFGHTMSLHPVSVLLALMLWGFLWGSVGMILSVGVIIFFTDTQVPITAVLKICLESVDHPLTKVKGEQLV